MVATVTALSKHPDDEWYRRRDCPFIGSVPREFSANLRFRRKLLNSSKETKKQILSACSRDILFYINSMIFTYNPKDFPLSPIRPMITWPYQDEAILDVRDAVGVEDIGIKKSRDMGATWICLEVFEWFWRFMPGVSFLVVSRNDDYVDKTGDVKSLFWKLDFLRENQPIWMIPNVYRIKKHMRNLSNGATIDGEATVSELGRGDRRSAIMLDERASIPNGDQVNAATRDATNCRISNSTPKGMYGEGKAFYDVCHNQHIKKIEMHWSQHPLKAVGIYEVDRGLLKILDTEYDFPSDYDFVLDGHYPKRSPWFDLQCKRADNEAEISQELEIDFLSASHPFFDVMLLKLHEEKNALEPIYQGRIDYNFETFDGDWIEGKNGPLKLWTTLDHRGGLPYGQTYIVGCDIAAGLAGDYSSNSVAQIINQVTGEQIGEFVVNDQSPPEFAQTTVAICKWLGGAHLIWEDNGPLGVAFGKEVQRIGYSNFYYRNVKDLDHRKKTRKPGYYHQDGGSALLSEMQRAMRSDEFIIRSNVALQECRQYEFRDGKLVHIGSVKTDDHSAKGKSHGDRVIALGLCWEARSERPVEENVEEETDRPAPRGSMAWRMELKNKSNKEPEFCWNE